MSNGCDGHPTPLETVAIFAFYTIIACAGVACVAVILI